MSTERTPLVTDERIATLAESYADMMMTKNDGESYSTHLGGYEFGAKELRNRYEAALASKDAEIEALRNPWISVEDRLPEKGTTVLVLGPTEDGDGVGMDALDPDSDGTTWIEWSNAHERYISCGVPESVGPSEDANYTHWSPIPPQP